MHNNFFIQENQGIMIKGEGFNKLSKKREHNPPIPILSVPDQQEPGNGQLLSRNKNDLPALRTIESLHKINPLIHIL